MKDYCNKLLSTTSFLIGTVLILSIIPPGTVDSEENIQSNESIFEKVGDIGVQKASKKGLTTPINKEIKINGQTILLTESLYDGSSIHLAYLIKSYNEKDGPLENRISGVYEFTINESLFMLDRMGARGEVLENGDYVGIISIDFLESIPESFTLGIESLHDDSVLVQIPIKLKGESTSIPVKETKKSANKEITYDKVTFYPTTTEILLQNIINEDQRHFLMDIKLRVTDETGRILQPLRASSSGVPLGNGKIKVTANYYFEPLEPTPKSLLIQPYLQDFKENKKPVTVRKKWEGKEFTLSQGEAGSLKILDVKEEKDLLIVTYDATGEQDHQQIATIWVEDAKGNYYPGNYPPKQLSKNKFQVTFSSVDHLEEFYICTAKLHRLNYIRELETTVQIKD